MPAILRRLLLLLLCIAPCALAQTRNYPADIYGGATSLPCSWPPASEIGITNIVLSSGTYTVTVASTAGIGPVGAPNTRPIYITGVTDTFYNSSLAAQASNATVASATTLTFPGSGSHAASSGGFVVPANFYTQQIGSQLWECTPAGNRIFIEALGIMQPAGTLTQSNNAATRAAFASKYGSNLANSVAGTYNLVTQLGNFNTIGDNTNGSQLPASGACGGTCEQLPEMDVDFGDLYATNPANVGAPGTVNPMLDNGQTYDSNANLTNGVANVVQDAFSPNFLSFENWYLLNFSGYNGKNKTPYEVFVGIGRIDARSIGGGAGPDFITPGNPGANDNDLAAMLFQTSPLQTYTPGADRAGTALVYADPLNYDKAIMASPPATCGLTHGTECSFATYLQKKYSTIGALNTAWAMSGFTYTTFGSSGTCIGYTYTWCNSQVATENYGSGNGSTVTFAHTLAHTHPSPNSIQVYVGGVLVAGDCPSGRVASKFADSSGHNCPVSAGNTTISGPTISSGHCVLATGVCTITFTTAPPSGTNNITIKYVDSGWGTGLGTGIMDEDGAHIPWGANKNTVCILPVANPTSYVPGSQSAACWNGNGTWPSSTWNTNAATDLTNWDTELVAQYQDSIHAAFKAATPNLELFTGQFYGNWNAPAPNYYLKGLGNFVDGVWLNILFNYPSQAIGNAMINYITAATPLPLLNQAYLSACPDSASAATFVNGSPPTCNSSLAQLTQPAKAAQLNNVVTSELGSAAQSSSGLQQFIGYSLWGGLHDCDSTDFPVNNWGIMTCSDNPYNAHDAASTAVSCTDQPGAAANSCGNEPAPTEAGATRPFGDFFGGTTGATTTNALWLTPPGPTFPWTGILAPTRAIDWSKAGVTGGIPNYTTISTTIAPFGLDNRGTVNSNGSVMTVTSVTKGTNVAAAWASIGPPAVNNVALEPPNSTGSMNSGPTWVYTANAGSDTFNTVGGWNGLSFTMTHGGTPYTGTIASTTATTVTFTAQPHSIGGLLAPSGGGYSTGGTAISATISSVDTVNHTFTVSTPPSIAVSGYIFAGSGSPATINSAASTCTGGQVVSLGAGTFNLIQGVTLVGVNGCVLRGAGADKTFIHNVIAGGNCGGNNAVICIGDATSSVAPFAYPNTPSTVLPGGTNFAQITGASAPGVYNSGDTQLTLTNVGSAGGGLHLNQIFDIDQEDTFNAVPGFNFCTRGDLAAGGHPPTMCGQDLPFSGRAGFTFTGTASITSGSPTVTCVTGCPFITDGSWDNASIILLGTNALQKTILAGSVTSTTLTMTANATNTGTFTWLLGYRGQTQVVQITGGPACLSSGGCTGAGPFTVTITPGLYGENWKASQNPAAWFPTGFSTFNVGVENMSLDKADDVSGSSTTIGFENVHDAWAKGLRTLHGDRSHYFVGYSRAITIQDGYIYGTKAASTQSYGTEQDSSSDILFQNMICQQEINCIVVVSAAGSVFGYNFGLDNYESVNAFTNPIITGTQITASVATYTYSGGSDYSSGCGGTCANFIPVSVAGTTNGGGIFNVTNVKITSATSTQFTVPIASLPCAPSCPTTQAFQAENGISQASGSVMSATYISHGEGTRYTLSEGNIGDQWFADAFHGGSNGQTVFRNYWAGFEKNKGGTGQSTGAGSIWPFRFDSLNRYTNMLGNVLGTSGITNGYQQYPGCPSGCPTAASVYFWTTFAINGGTGGTTNTVDTDPLTQSTSMRWGNCDIFSTPSCQFNSAEVPTGDTFGYANTVPASQTLPASFYLSAQPSWFTTPFGTPPYPVIGPDVAGGTALAANLLGTTAPPGGHAYDNAASKCYQNSPIDSSYVGFDRGVLLFNASNCYGTSTGAPTATLTPNPLAFGNQNINTTSSGGTATFTNTSSQPVIVSGVAVTGNFTNTGAGSCTGTSFTLPALTSCTFVITFSPSATIAYSGTLSVTDNASGSPQVINLTGQGTAPIITWSSPQGGTTYNYGNVLVGGSATSGSLTLQNTGTGPLSLSVAGLSITGTNAGQFSIFSSSCPDPLPAGNSCGVVVTFTPAAAASYTAFLTETDTVQGLSANLTLNGTGVTSVPITAPWAPILLGGK